MALRVAVVGTGMIANAAHIPAWTNLKGRVELIAVLDRNPVNAKNTAQRHSIPHACEDLKKMLEEHKPDIVSVCTPNVSHAGIVRTCLESGAHVLCEKPLTTSYQDAKMLYDLAETMGVHLVAAQTYRFNSQIEAAKSLTANGRLGDIYYAEAAAFRRRGIPKWGLFHVADESAGGPLFDLGVHVLDAMNWIMGNPKVISATGATYKNTGFRDEDLVTSLADSGAPVGLFDPRPYSPEEFTVEDMGVGFLRFDNRMTLSLRTSWAANVPEGFGRTIIMGTKAGMALDPLTLIGTTGRYQSDTVPIVPADPEIPFYGHWKITKHMVDLIEGKEEQIVRPAEVLNVLKALTALYESADTGREISIN
jgi:predicted dehydrogenase